MSPFVPRRPKPSRFQVRILIPCLAALAVSTGSLFAQPGGTTNGVDVIVGSLQQVASYGSSGGISAFSVGTTSCNIGTQNLLWIAGNNQHPVIGQNMFRLKDGVLEQIGQSWLKHGFFALSQELCSGPGGCNPTSGSTLGVGCSDPYTATRNGGPGGLGPRSQVNPATGFFPFPPATPPSGNPTIGRRIQVPNNFLQASANNPDLLYFVDGQYVTPDDAAAGNHFNNVSVQEVRVNGAGASYSITRIGDTFRQRSAIEHWAELFPDVVLHQTTANNGRFFVGARVLELPNGDFQYEYAVYNMNFHEAIGSVSASIPSADTVVSSAFHAPQTKHSNEPPDEYSASDFDNSAWLETISDSSIRWETPSVGAPVTNPIRWGSQYNFRLITNAPPADGTLTVGAWRTADTFDFTVPTPTDDFISGVADLTCSFDETPAVREAILSWTHPDSYDSIKVLRDGQPIATLAGDATSFADSNETQGVYVYSVAPVQNGEDALVRNCEVAVPEIPKIFDFTIESTTLPYDTVTGVGSGETTISILEDPFNNEFPNQVAGFEFAVTFDSTLVSVVSVDESPDMTAVLAPDFFAGAVMDTTPGFTVGVVFDFVGVEFFDFSASTEVAVVGLESVSAALAGNNAGTATELFFEDDVHGAFTPIVGQVVLAAAESTSPTYNDAIITLDPSGEAAFSRGEVNGDGNRDIADSIFVLEYLFVGGNTPSCFDAADLNDDGLVDIADAILGLEYLFLPGSPAPAAPFPGCGIDPTADNLDCGAAPGC